MLLTGLLALGLAQPASPPEQPVVPPNRWTVDYGRISCTLARRIGGESSPIVALNLPLGNEPGELLIMNGESGLDARFAGDLEIRLDDGAPIALRATRQRRNGRPIVRLAPLPDDFTDRLAGARQLFIGGRGRDLLVLALDDAREGVGELMRCNDDLLQSWGIDVAARRALSRQPIPRSWNWAASVMPAQDAVLVLAADVDEAGRPLDCRILHSSGNPRMDQAVCRVVRSRARFRPALDAGGRPVTAPFVTRVTWRVED